jgi:hypothetical protein
MPSRAHRTQKQLEELRRDVKRTLRDLGKAYPNEDKSEDVLRSHRVRVNVLLNQQRTIRVRYDPRGKREEPYPLTPVTVRDVVVILVVFLSLGGGIGGLLWVLSLTGW